MSLDVSLSMETDLIVDSDSRVTLLKWTYGEMQLDYIHMPAQFH